MLIAIYTIKIAILCHIESTSTSLELIIFKSPFLHHRFKQCLPRPPCISYFINIQMELYKKAWRSYLLPVPRLEALALAHSVRTSNARTHADEFI